MGANCLTEFEWIVAIVNDDVGSRVLRIAKMHGILGGTIFYGQGTVKSRLLEWLDLTDVRKEIVMMVSKSDICRYVMKKLNSDMHLRRPHHGIVFSMPVGAFIGARNQYVQKTAAEKVDEGERCMYQAIFTIVEKGKAEEVTAAANAAGATGGTVINARGSGVHETERLFSMDIEPEKEIVLSVVRTEITKAVIENIRTALKIDEPGNGIIFVQQVSEVYGLH